MKGSLRSDSDRDDDHRAPHRDPVEPTGLARIPAQGGAQTFCRTCLAPAPEQLLRIVGTWSVVAGLPVWDCQDCTRTLIQEFESGADLRPKQRLAAGTRA